MYGVLILVVELCCNMKSRTYGTSELSEMYSVITTPRRWSEEYPLGSNPCQGRDAVHITCRNSYIKVSVFAEIRALNAG